ncbi:MAG: sulfatase-like hydrolase/transferase [Candidatus Aminicenantes bacterium]|nr:sulfatase-like hydrolase/transferase [Candidatus Aminicenantes bacterium]
MYEKKYTFIRVLILVLGVALCLAQLFCSHKEETILYDLYHLKDFASLKEQTLFIDFGSLGFRKYLTENWGFDEQLPEGRTVVWGLEGGSTLWFESLSLQDIAAYLVCKTMAYEGAPSQSLKVIVNDKPLISLSLTSSFKQYLIYIPSSLLRQGVNYLQFVPQYAIAPRMADEGSKDTRKLNVYFDYLLLKPVEWHKKGFRFEPSSTSMDRKPIHEKKKEASEIELWRMGLWERSYNLKIPPHSRFKYSIGFTSEEYDPISPFKIDIVISEKEGREKLLRSLSFNRKALKSPKRLADDTIDLSPYWNKVVKLTLRFFLDETSSFNPTRRIYFHPRIVKDKTKAKKVSSQRKLARRAESQLQEIRKACAGSNVLIFVMDAAQPSHMSAYGYHRKTTPNIDGIGKDGTIFLNGYCQAVYTRASVASLMTGLYTDVHDVLHPEDKLNNNAVTMTEVFQNSGYQTAAFVAMGNASSAFGFQQGFDYFYESFKQETYTARAEDFLPALLPWIEEHRSEPFFLYVHFREPHSLIDPPSPFTDMFDKEYQGSIDPHTDRERIMSHEIEMTPRDLYHIIATYDASIYYVDSIIGKITDKLKSCGLYNRTIIIIIADHGEALWEHGFFGHNVHLYEEISRIPFIIKLPSPAGIEGLKNEALVQTIDLFPTLVDILQLPTHNAVLQGNSLLPLLAGSTNSVNEFLYFRTLWQTPRYGVRGTDYKYIYYTRTGEEELYNLRDDPQERTNLMGSKEAIEIENYFRQQLSIWLHQQRSLSRIYSVVELASEIDEATIKNLKALGYITN